MLSLPGATVKRFLSGKQRLLGDQISLAPWLQPGELARDPRPFRTGFFPKQIKNPELVLVIISERNAHYCLPRQRETLKDRGFDGSDSAS